MVLSPIDNNLSGTRVKVSAVRKQAGIISSQSLYSTALLRLGVPEKRLTLLPEGAFLMGA